MTGHHTEKAFEDQIDAHLLAHGWIQGSDADFDPKRAIDRKHLVGFIADTQPELWEKLEQQYGVKAGDQVLKDLAAMSSGKEGMLGILRHGLEFRGRTIRLATFKPAFGLNPDLIERYEKNRLLVYRQVRFQPNRDDIDLPQSVDMMLALNGIPIATIELKNQATGQSVDNAIKQYRKRETHHPLFKFKTGALVHFAVDPFNAYMTTRLRGEDTVFLPFNKGHNNGEGNPPNPNGHRTAYLWEEIFERESFLDILARFLHLERDEESGSEIMIFPRYHQLDCVRKLTAAALHDGPGESYLVQHSTGSGKSNSIAWLAHRLQSLHREEGGEEKKLFDSIVVVTDRRILDRQLQETIWQIDHTPGLVKRIDKNAKQLAKAIKDSVPVIITTLQKFPFARITGALDELPERRYAVIADEAHSSQTGETARELRRTLGSGVLKDGSPEYAKTVSLDEDDGPIADVEDEMRKVMESRQKQKNLSFFAFTATPKGKTLKFFGTPTEDGKHEPAHLYSMRQAIEEGFILDVLQSYTTEATYFKLLKKVDEDPQVDEQSAAKALSRFHRTHSDMIAKKMSVIADHFHTSVRHKIDGLAKAMIVTSSREAAVKYRLAYDKYVQQQGYEGMDAYVAFSGTVKLDTGGEHTEYSMNGITETELRDAFRKSETVRVLIVADKYQTGYDEPLLHTMYVDKKLHGVAAVQTLSRLNRRYKNLKQDTFVLDFVNKAKEIKESFQPFYEVTTVGEGADHTELYKLKNELLAWQIIHWDDVEAFAKDFYVPREKVSKEQHGKWLRHLEGAVERFAEIEKDESKELFRSQLGAYVRLYSYLSQLMGFAARDLEMLYSYGRFLALVLPREETEGVDLKGMVDLESLVFETKHSGAIELVKSKPGVVSAPGGAAPTAAKPRKKSPLSEMIDKINERIKSRFGGAPEHLIEGVIEGLTYEPTMEQRATANKYEDFRVASDVQKEVVQTFVKHHGENKDFVEAFVNDEEGIKSIVMDGVLKEVYRRVRERIAAEKGIDPKLLADIGMLRNRLEPKLRRLVKRSIKMHKGDTWIREVLKVFNETRRKQCQGVDADIILRERMYLLDLIQIIHTRWNDFFKAFESGPPKTRLTRDQVKVLLDYINTHREDAHAGAFSEGELATLKIAVSALDAAVDRMLED